MNRRLHRAVLLLATIIFSLAYSPSWAAGGSESGAEAVEPEKGPHRGRMLRNGDFAVELSIFETGVPPEYRVWLTREGKPVAPEEVELTVTLIRLGDKQDVIRFRPQEDFLRGDLEIYEPHSFVVNVQAKYRQQVYEWEYDNFEGRTRITDDIAEAMGIETGIAGGETLVLRLPAFGRLVPDVNAEQRVSARFEGVITALHVTLGQSVRRGDALLTIESNESLKPYTLRAAMAGEVVALPVNVGESTAGRKLLVLRNSQKLLAELQVFATDLADIKLGNTVELRFDEQKVAGTIQYIPNQLSVNQAATLRVALSGDAAGLRVGQFVKAAIEVDRFDVPLAVRRSALQGFRDFTVVYAKVGDQYEVRMLELGRQSAEWVEVLGGLEPGTEYVTGNSYLIKADIEKTGASHDH